MVILLYFANSLSISEGGFGLRLSLSVYATISLATESFAVNTKTPPSLHEKLLKSIIFDFMNALCLFIFH